MDEIMQHPRCSLYRCNILIIHFIELSLNFGFQPSLFTETIKRIAQHHKPNSKG